MNTGASLYPASVQEGGLPPSPIAPKANANYDTLVPLADPPGRSDGLRAPPVALRSRDRVQRRLCVWMEGEHPS